MCFHKCIYGVLFFHELFLRAFFELDWWQRARYFYLVSVYRFFSKSIIYISIKLVQVSNRYVLTQSSQPSIFEYTQKLSFIGNGKQTRKDSMARDNLIKYAFDYTLDRTKTNYISLVKLWCFPPPHVVNKTWKLHQNKNHFSQNCQPLSLCKQQKSVTSP